MRELAAMEEALGLRENEKLRAQLAESEQRVKFVESVNAKQEQFVCNTLGKALGFPTDPEGEGICCGDEVLESLCEMGAKRISDLEQRVKALEEALAPVVEWWKVEKKLEEKFEEFPDYVLGFTHKGEISNKVTVNQLDAIARLVGEE